MSYLVFSHSGKAVDKCVRIYFSLDEFGVISSLILVRPGRTYNFRVTNTESFSVIKI